MKKLIILDFQNRNKYSKNRKRNSKLDLKKAK